MEKALISIIIPVFNAKKYLRDCIESILNQSYNNFEILLIDDGSTDGSDRICDSYAKLDKRIAVFHINNGGAAVARNIGLENAKGKYIAFADSDDYYEQSMLENMSLIANENEAHIVCCAHRVVDKDGNTIIERNVNGPEGILDGEEALRRLLFDDEIQSFVWDKLYLAELIKKFRFVEGNKVEDMVINSQIFRQDIRVYRTNEVLYNYRQVETSVQHIRGNKIEIDQLQLYFEEMNSIGSIHLKLQKELRNRCLRFAIYAYNMQILNGGHDVNLVLTRDIISSIHLREVSGVDIATKVKAFAIVRCPNLYGKMYKKIKCK